MKVASAALMALKLSVSSTQLEDFLAGFYSSMFNKDKDFNIIESCLNQDSVIQGRFQQAAADISSGDIQKMAQGGTEVAAIFAISDVDFIEDCQALQDDGVRFDTWAASYEDLGHLMSTLITNVKSNLLSMEGDFTEASAFAALGMYKQAGGKAADLMTLALGPLPDQGVRRF